MADHRESFVQLVRDGCLEAIAEISADEDDPIVAFALCTDDDVSGFFHLGLKETVSRGSAFRNLRFMPNEWPDPERAEPAPFKQANQRLQQSTHRPAGEGWS